MNSVDGVVRYACQIMPLSEPRRRSHAGQCRHLARCFGICLRVRDDRLCQVGYDACVACCKAGAPSPEKINPVIASFLFQIGTAVIEAEGLPDCTVEEAIELKAWAFSNLKWAPGSKTVGRPQTCYASPKQYVRRAGRMLVTWCCVVPTRRPRRNMRCGACWTRRRRDAGAPGR